MIKTALSILQSVRYRMNLSAPSTLIGLTDPDELQMLHLLYAVCEELRQARCWPQLKRTYTFNTVSGQATYQLPRDFYAPLLRTHWNSDEDQRLIGPLDDDSYKYLLESGSPSTQNYSFRVFGRDENPASNSGQFHINPTPSPYPYATGGAYAEGDRVTASGNVYTCTTAIGTATTAPSGTTTSADDTGVWTYVSAFDSQTLAFEYVTRSFLLPQNWAASTSYAANVYVNASGNIYQKGAGTATSGTTVPSHTTGTGSDGTITWTYISAAYETVIADTDLVVFDDDLVKLGLRAKWMEENGGDYSQAKAEFEAKIEAAVARYKGPYYGSFAGKEAGRAYSVTPRRGWSL